MVVVQSPRRPRMIARRRAFVLLLFFAGIAALAGPPPMLRATVNELAPRARTAAPEWIEVVVNSGSTAIREGALEFTMIEWGFPLYRYRTNDLVINSGAQRYRFLLPAATSAGENSNRTLKLRFIEKAGPTSLGEFPLIASQRSNQARIIAVIRPNYSAGGSNTPPLWQSLNLDRFAPADGLRFDTLPIFLDPADVPLDPLGFFPFDLVLIESDALEKMREKTRTALGQWVNAGGSLCVMADHPLKAENLETLNQLAAVDPRWKPLTSDESGRVIVPEGAAFARVNFGRLAVMSELPPDDAEKTSPAWRRACTFLWRMRTAQAEIVVNEGTWDLNRDYPMGDNESQWAYAQRMRPFNYAQWTRFEAPVIRIFPEYVRVVPLWLLAIFLVGYLALVGPGDWFFLGAIRRHRLTWLLFPILAVLVTGGTIFLVRRYMGTAGHAGAIVISDIGATGRVVRETRIEFELPATGKLASTAVSNALRLPAPAPYLTRKDHSAWSNLEYQGQYPARYNYTRTQRQWSPETSRVTAIVDAPDTSGIKWDAFDAKFFEEYEPAFDETRQQNEKQSPKELRSLPQAVYQATGVSNQRDVSFSFFTKWGTRDSGYEFIDKGWRKAITLAEPVGSSGLLIHVSPNGYPQFGDLRILERADPSRIVILIAKHEGKNIHVWRRLYLQ
jgi:hypothetical protein